MKLEKNWLEWTVFALSALLTVAVIGVLARDAFGKHEPARLAVMLGAAEKATGGWRVPVRVDNSGGVTAATVAVEVARAGSDELGEIEFDFVPRRSYREGWVLFSVEPRGLAARVRGYQAP